MKKDNHDEVLYKYLNSDGSAPHGVGKWNLPGEDGPGEWMPPITGELVPCRNGYHACREEDLLSWRGEALFTVEFDGELMDAGNKVVGRRARLLRRVDGWNDTNLRLFAADCAERVLPVYENLYPDDSRPRRAVEAARGYAEGEISDEELAAARDAARDAARAAAWVAAGDAVWAAAEATAWDAASAAAWVAAGAAARDAAEAAAWAAERRWQQERLMYYLRGDGAADEE